MIHLVLVEMMIILNLLKDTRIKDVRVLISNLERAAANLKKELAKGDNDLTSYSEVTSKQRIVVWSKRFVRNILWITFLWQLINIIVLMIVCQSDPGAQHNRNGKILFGYYGLVVIQIISTIGILGAAGRLTQQVVIHESISGWFLSQCYLATVISFTGLYMLTYRLDPQSWKIVDLEDENNISFIIKLFVRFLHLSSSTATLCGISNVTPTVWYNYLASTIQMLLSFTYFASILGKIIGSHHQKPSSHLLLDSLDLPPSSRSSQSTFLGGRSQQMVYSINSCGDDNMVNNNNNISDIDCQLVSAHGIRRRTASFNV